MVLETKSKSKRSVTTFRYVNMSKQNYVLEIKTIKNKRKITNLLTCQKLKMQLQSIFLKKKQEVKGALEREMF